MSMFLSVRIDIQLGYFAESDEDEDREITLDDIGYWEEVMDDGEREIALPPTL